VDFTAADLDGVEFMGCQLDSVRLPEDVIRIPRAYDVTRRQLRLLEGDDSRQARIVRAALEHSLKGPQDKKADGIFRRGDYLEFGEDVAALAESPLRDAMKR